MRVQRQPQGCVGARSFLFAAFLGNCAMRTLNPQKIFEHARKFQWANEFLRSNHITQETVHSAADPSMVLSAFACELYLKCLLCIEGKTGFDKIHDLKRLFDMLGPDLRRRIEQVWDADIWQPFRRNMLAQVEGAGQTRIPRSLSWALKAGALAFVKLRYVFEEPKRDIKFILGDFPEVLKKVILEIHPYWR